MSTARQAAAPLTDNHAAVTIVVPTLREALKPLAARVAEALD